MPLFSATKTRPSRANWTAIGRVNPLRTVVSLNPDGSVVAAVAEPVTRTAASAAATAALVARMIVPPVLPPTARLPDEASLPRTRERPRRIRSVGSAGAAGVGRQLRE